jgi:hypothetical protein
MFKRTVWFTVGMVGGAVTGAGATAYGFVRWREARGALAPDRVADTLVSTARTVGASVGSSARTVGSSSRAVRDSARANVRDAVAEGRLAMAEAESRIIDELDRRDHRGALSPDGAAGLGQ